MNRYTLIVWSLALIISIGCSGTSPSPDKAWPSLTLDETHNQASGKDAAKYSIAPTDAVTVDAAEYKFNVPAKLAVDGPNSIHVIHSADKYYRAKWNGKGKIILDRKTLESMKGTGSFPGFKSGENYVIGIGHDSISETDKKLSFSVMWAGMVEVK